MLKIIEQIATAPIDKLNEVQKEMEPVLEHNYNLIKALTPESMLQKLQ